MTKDELKNSLVSQSNAKSYMLKLPKVQYKIYKDCIVELLPNGYSLLQDPVVVGSVVFVAVRG